MNRAAASDRPAGRSPASTLWLLTTSVLALESLVVFFATLTVFGLRANPLPGAAIVGGGLGLVVLFLLGCLVLRTSWGLVYGWLLQVLLLVLGFFEFSMFIVGALFALTWWYAIRLGSRIDAEKGARSSPQ